MHDGMPCDTIRDQGQGHDTTKVGNSSIFKIYFLRHLQLDSGLTRAGK